MCGQTQRACGQGNGVASVQLELTIHIGADGRTAEA